MIDRARVLKTGAVGTDACSRLAWDDALATMPARVDSAADATEVSRAPTMDYFRDRVAVAADHPDSSSR